jgi:hypothetical protein
VPFQRGEPKKLWERWSPVEGLWREFTCSIHADYIFLAEVWKLHYMFNRPGR